MPRTSPHTIETKSHDLVRKEIHSFYRNGDALIREWSERDYGVDLILELFDEGVPTGKLAFLQVKGTEKDIEKLHKTNEVSCKGVSISCLEYAKQKRIPFMLIYVSINAENFYFVDLQSRTKFFQEANGKNKSKETTIRIPFDNQSKTNLALLFEIVNSYYQ